MTEFGIVLRDNTVCPAATFQAAADQAVALGAPLVRRFPLSTTGWHRIGTPLPLWQPPYPVRGRWHEWPWHGTVREHRRRHETPCGPCRRWWAAYSSRTREARRSAA